MTAQETYRRLMQSRIGPALRERGFKGSGSTWTLPHEVYWLMVGFQKSRHSDVVEVKFTINLLALSKARWDAANFPRGRVSERPTPNTFGLPATPGALADPGWHGRIGQVIPNERGDRWWSLHATVDDLDLIAGDVLGCLEQWGLPKLRAVLTEAAAASPRCAHNVGWRNDYRACGLPADSALRSKNRRYFRCREHAEWLPSNGEGVEVVGHTPNLWPS